MPKSQSISQLFQTPKRFLRSVQLERDFHDVAALEQYVVTPPMAEAFRRIADGLRAKSGRRAWRITGDYGVGKSSFALVLAHLLRGRPSRTVGRISEAIGWSGGNTRMWPVLLTGSREGISQTVARGLAEALRQRKPARGRTPRTLASLIDQATNLESSSDTGALERLFEAVRAQAAEEGAGLLLVVDELGKLLEHASQRPEREDVFVLQRLAELAARSGDRPFLVLGLLHQGFHAYAERLPSAVRHEWEKVAGRFDEIVFDQPLAHTAALVSGALNLDSRRLPTPVRDAAADAARATAATGWLGGGTTGAATLDAARLYPLHPTLLPVLVRFFARFGQHERSLFGFLLSSEPFGLQAFSARGVGADAWYSLADFYDYIRAVFGHRLAGASYRNQWLRILATVDSAVGVKTLEERVLKMVAVLNLLDSEDLLATDHAVRAAFAPESVRSIDAAIAQLVRRGLLFRRGQAGGYRLWPNSSVSLETAFQAAIRAVGPVETVASNLERYIDREPILARRHYVERGTLRYFEVRLANPGALIEVLARPSEGDGIVVLALSDTEKERQIALEAATGESLKSRADVLIAVVQPLLGLAPEVQDLRCWEWVGENTPALADDAYTAAEVARQRFAARRSLTSRLASIVGLRAGTATEVQWYRQGRAMKPPKSGGLSALLSEICDQLYPKAPQITNELLNRNTLSSAAAAARMRLIEGLFNAGDRPYLGIDPHKAPPEKSMYLSVIQKGHVHIQEGDLFRIVEPAAKKDPLRLRPAFDRLIEQIERGRGDRVSVEVLLASLRQQPYGVRSGVAPLLLAILLRTRAHELAVYEHGTFLHRFGPSDFLRLTKAPGAFEIQHCQVKGVRVEVFEQLAAAFAGGVSDRRPDLLDVVRPLCQFAAQLPEYTRRSASLGREALRVRDSLLSAREPITLLFRDLPEACGADAFAPDQSTDHDRVQGFIATLHEAIGELRGAYPELLGRIVDRVAEAGGDDRNTFDRARLAARAARVSLAAREPRLRTFALRLRDPGLSDEAWAEALASFVVAKPPSRWLASDEARFSEEVSALAELFHRVEATAFSTGDSTPAIEAIRLNLTRGDGEDLIRVIEPRTDDADLSRVAESFSGLLPQDRHARLDVLARLLWKELSAAKADVAVGDSNESHLNRERTQ